MWAMYINADNCMESNMLLLLSLSKAQDIPHGLLESSGCNTLGAIENSSVLMREGVRLMSISGVIKNHKLVFGTFK